MEPTAATCDIETQSKIIEETITRLNRDYIFPEKAKELEELLRLRLTEGTYTAYLLPDDFCTAVTADMQNLTRDKHLRLRYRSTPHPLDEEASNKFSFEEHKLNGILYNYGFAKVERLTGNVGYLDLRLFYDASIAGDTAVATMNWLANTYALIVDLRKNGGGSPGMIALLTTYLFEQGDQVHLNTFYSRAEDSARQSWTLPYVPGLRYLDKPVYVLTSNYTFSGAEEFTYNLKNLKRATIIGEITGGGAHPGGWQPLDAHYELFVPSGRPVNPISGTNWEGTGVAPDIEVPKEQAFDQAYRLALQAVLEKLGENPAGPYKNLAEEVQAKLVELEKPVQGD
jgi:C-terminal processing protease CtpA/Prc